jgi:ABC-type phosphate transport system auxiliary subunit
VRTSIVVITLVIVIGVLGIVSWRWVDVWWSQRALAAHFESRKPYAARVIEEIGVLPDELRAMVPTSTPSTCPENC